MIKIRYKLGKSGYKGYGRLLCLVTADGKITDTAFATGLMVKRDEWQQGPVYRSISDERLNANLQELEDDLFRCYNDLKKVHETVSGNMVKKAYKKKDFSTMNLYKLSEMIVEKVSNTPKRKERTIIKNQSYHNKLFTFFTKDTPLSAIDEDMANAFYWHMVKNHNNSNNHAVRCIQYLKRCLEFARKMGYVRINKLEAYDISFDYNPVPEHLEDWEVKKLEGCKFNNPTYDVIRDIFILITETGMDYSDIKNVNPESDLVTFQDVLCIQKGRYKNGKPFFVPLSDKAIKIFRRYDWKPCRYTLQYFNREVKKVAKLAGIKKNISTKTGRKTAATRWLNDGFSIEVVSKMLGHTKISTTQRYYAQIKKNRILDEWLKISN